MKQLIDFQHENFPFEVNAVLRDKDGNPIGRRLIQAHSAAELEEMYNRLNNVIPKKRRKKKKQNKGGRVESMPTASEAQNIIQNMLTEQDNEVEADDGAEE